MEDHSKAETRRLLGEVATATLTALLEERGYRNAFMTGVHPLGPELQAVGRARTLRYVPHRPDLMPPELARNPQRVAIESVQPGEVLVVDAGGEQNAGVFGDILASRTVKLGAVALVVDGAVRDGAEIASLGLVVQARAVHGAAHRRQLVPVETNVPIRCGGCAVIPGDWIVCDADGVVVVPGAQAPEALKLAQEFADTEERVKDAIARGVDPVEAHRQVNYDQMTRHSG